MKLKEIRYNVTNGTSSHTPVRETYKEWQQRMSKKVAEQKSQPRKEIKLINGQHFDVGFRHLENEILQPPHRSAIVSTIQKYYQTEVDKDFNFLAPDAIEQLEAIINKSGFPFGKGGKREISELIQNGKQGVVWNMSFSRDASNNRLEREIQRLYLRHDGFLVYSTLTTRKGRKRCSCWVLPHEEGFLFLQGDAITARKLGRLVSEWAHIPYRPNIPHTLSGEQVIIKRDAVHLMGENALAVEAVDIHLNSLENR